MQEVGENKEEFDQDEDFLERLLNSPESTNLIENIDNTENFTEIKCEDISPTNTILDKLSLFVEENISEYVPQLVSTINSNNLDLNKLNTATFNFIEQVFNCDNKNSSVMSDKMKDLFNVGMETKEFNPLESIINILPKAYDAYDTVAEEIKEWTTEDLNKFENNLTSGLSSFFKNIL